MSQDLFMSLGKLENLCEDMCIYEAENSRTLFPNLQPSWFYEHIKLLKFCDANFSPVSVSLYDGWKTKAPVSHRLT